MWKNNEDKKRNASKQIQTSANSLTLTHSTHFVTISGIVRMSLHVWYRKHSLTIGTGTC